MKLARVLGSVWGEIKAEGLAPFKLLEVCPLHFAADGSLQPGSGLMVVLDRLEAGPGDLVLVGHGSRIRDIGLNPEVPVKELVVAIVDDVSVQQ